MDFFRNSIISIEQFTVKDMLRVFDKAKRYMPIVDGRKKFSTKLRGRKIVTLFYEPSTRTRTSFELAASLLGATVVNINVPFSSVTKGESLRDTLSTLEAMGFDAIIFRHFNSCAADYAASCLNKAILINAGDGAHAHPSQALLDCFTVLQHQRCLAGLKVVILGDFLHSRVARSDFLAFNKFGADIHAAAPPSLFPRFFEGIHFHDNTDQAVADADVIIVLRLQNERFKQGLFPPDEYHRHFGLTSNRLKLAKPDAIVLHPGPQNLDVEIAYDVAHSNQALIHDQVHNGVAIRMALLNLSLCEVKLS